MNTKSLLVFLEVARTGSFSTAARNLGLTQPAVSFQVRALEKECGNVLIDRSSGRCRLTEAGETLRKYAQKMLRAEEELRREMDSMRSEISGSLSIAASNIPGEYILPSLLARFRERHPLVDPRLAVADSEKVLEWVKEGGVDLGCVGFPVEDEKLRHGVLCSDRLVFIAPKDHPLSHKKHLEPGDLEGQSFVWREEGSGTRSHMVRILTDLGINARPEDSVQLGSTMAVIQAVAAGAGISLSSAWAVEPFFRLGRVSVLRLGGVRDLRRDFHYLLLRRRPSTGAVESLVDFLEEMRPELDQRLREISF